MSHQDLTLASVGVVDSSTLHFHHKEFKIQVQVPALKGSPTFKTKLTAFSYETIGSLKLNLFKKELSELQVNPGSFQLLLKGVPLMDVSLFGELDVQGRDSNLVLNLESNSSVGILIVCYDDNGAHWDMRVKPSLVIAELKQMICEKISYLVEHQTLKFGQEVLENETRLSDYELINNGSEIDVLLTSVPIKVLNQFNGEETIVQASASSCASFGEYYFSECKGLEARDLTFPFFVFPALKQSSSSLNGSSQ